MRYHFLMKMIAAEMCARSHCDSYHDCLFKSLELADNVSQSSSYNRPILCCPDWYAEYSLDVIHGTQICFKHSHTYFNYIFQMFW